MRDFTVRPATYADDAALAELDLGCADPGTYVLRPTPGEPFFSADTEPRDVLVAESGGRPVGYVKVRPPTPLASHAHVQQIQGLAVHPTARRGGVARALLEAARAEAERRGARKLSLRVLSTNPGAAALYRTAGYQVEGVLVQEFRVAASAGGEEYADDVVMALPLTAARGSGREGQRHEQPRSAGYAPSWDSKAPSSSLWRTVVRKRAASAPSTMRWS